MHRKSRATAVLTLAMSCGLFGLTGCGKTTGASNGSVQHPENAGIKVANQPQKQKLFNAKLCLAQLKDASQAQSAVWSNAIAQVGKDAAAHQSTGKNNVQVVDVSVGKSADLASELKKTNCATVLGISPELDSELQKWAAKTAKVAVLSIGSPLSGKAVQKLPKNFTRIDFRLEQAAFLAGYAAAGTTQTGHLAVLMINENEQAWATGFKQGVDYYNRFKGAGIVVKNWDRVENRIVPVKASDLTAQVQKLGEKQVDLFYVLSGQLPPETWAYLGQKQSLVIWSGENVTIAVPEQKHQVLATVELNPQPLLKRLFAQISTGQLGDGFGKLDLSEAAVKLSDFGDQSARISPSLQKELQSLTEQLRSGKLDPRQLPTH